MEANSTSSVQMQESRDMMTKSQTAYTIIEETFRWFSCILIDDNRSNYDSCVFHNPRYCVYGSYFC